MKDATHFIEVFKNKPSGKLHQTGPHPVEYLTEQLEATKDCSQLETVAVWYIKPKEVNNFSNIKITANGN